MSVIYLIGFMGTGKTTTGRMLAHELQYTFYDMDEVVVDMASQSISDLFAEYGEDGFREFETKALQSLPLEKSVIATGGGAILREENRNYMKENGRVVWLDASPSEILKRVKEDTSRPLLAQDKKRAIESLYEKRENTYKQAADFKVATDGKNTEEIVGEIRTLLSC